MFTAVPWSFSSVLQSTHIGTEQKRNKPNEFITKSTNPTGTNRKKRWASYPSHHNFCDEVAQAPWSKIQTQGDCRLWHLKEYQRTTLCKIVGSDISVWVSRSYESYVCQFVLADEGWGACIRSENMTLCCSSIAPIVFSNLRALLDSTLPYACQHCALVTSGKIWPYVAWLLETVKVQ